MMTRAKDHSKINLNLPASPPQKFNDWSKRATLSSSTMKTEESYLKLPSMKSPQIKTQRHEEFSTPVKSFSKLKSISHLIPHVSTSKTSGSFISIKKLPNFTTLEMSPFSPEASGVLSNRSIQTETKPASNRSNQKSGRPFVIRQSNSTKKIPNVLLSNPILPGPGVSKFASHRR